MIIETDRLNLISLTVGQYRHWINNISILEKELSCSYQAEPLEGIFLNILKNQLIVTKKMQEITYITHFGFLLEKLIELSLAPPILKICLTNKVKSK